MGCKFSKTTVEAPPLPANLSFNPAPSELSSYEAACRTDPDLRTFDTTLQARTTRVFSTLAAAGGVDLHALSFESLKDVTGCLLDTNQEVVTMILEYQKDIWKNPELFELVEDYFETSLQTLDFCTVLEKCLRRTRDSQLILQVALRHFEEQEVRNAEEDGGGGRKHLKTMEELKNFKNAGDPFTEEFFQVFQLVHKQQIVMLHKLNLRKRKIDKKIRRAKAWRKFSGIIFAATFASVLICSVVAAAMAAPPVAAALAAAASVSLGSMGRWFDSLWKGYEVALRDQRGIISVMNAGSIVLIQDLESIRALVNKMRSEISSLMDNADFALRDDVALKLGIEEMKKKMGVFMQSIEDLSEHADSCSRDIRRARTVVLQKIIRQPK